MSSRPPHLPSNLKAVPEQERARELFLAGGNLRIAAYAGAGKTTTLTLLAAGKPGRGTYLAFNRSIAIDARGRFPAYVKCSTGHSIAFRAVSRTLKYPEWKLTGKLTASLMADTFRFPGEVSFRCGIVLERRSYASVLADGIRRFVQSSQKRPALEHVPRHGALEQLSQAEFRSFQSRQRSTLAISGRRCSIGNRHCLSGMTGTSSCGHCRDL